jgi:general secretion pathway protein A
MRSPFKGSPNPNLMYTTPALLGAIDKIRFMIGERQGLALILGDNGMGKSTVLRYLHAEYSAEGYTTGLLNQTEFPSPYALLKAICAQFGVEPKRSQALQHQAFESWLIEEFKAGRTAILFIDEGQRLDAEQLEVIRALLNFETYEDKLLQIVMAGTLELRDRIMAKRNKALRSRIFAPCMLNPMNELEIRGMIQFRCNRAGVENPFDDEGALRIYAMSGGVPRLALMICAHAGNMAQRLKLNRVPVDLIVAAKDEATIPEQESEAAAV